MSELSIDEQIALMNPTQLSFYRKHRRKAILFGVIQFWTIPVFSFPTIIPIVLAIAGPGTDPKYVFLGTLLGGGFILVPLAIGCGMASKHYRMMARNIRLAVLNAHAPMTDESNTLNP